MKYNINYINSLPENTKNIAVLASSIEQAIDSCKILNDCKDQLEHYKWCPGSSIDVFFNNIRISLISSKNVNYDHKYIPIVNAIKKRVNLFKLDSIYLCANGFHDNALLGFALNYYSWEFKKYKTKKKDSCKIDSCDANESKTCDLFIVSNEFQKDQDQYNKYFKNVISHSLFARDLITEPGSEIYPETFCKALSKRINDLGLKNIKIKEISHSQLEEMKAGGIIGVNKGSAKEARMLILEYNGDKSRDDYKVLVGKGVTYDTGGISLKPSQHMDDMKCDMSGAAAVSNTILALASGNVNTNAVAICPLVENNISNEAIKPGDIITMLSGKTVEVLNTDAEGRLILADALTYAQNEYKIEYMIDIATLTGAMIFVLGNLAAGVFTKNNELAEMLAKASDKTNERSWRLPLCNEYREPLNTTIADIANSRNDVRSAGSSKAASFLDFFIEKDIKWAHIDMANMSWEKGGQRTKGSGYGVRLLHALIIDSIKAKNEI